MSRADLGARIGADPELRVRSRGWTALVRLGLADPVDVAIAGGEVESVAAAGDGPADLVLHASPELWSELAVGSAERSFTAAVLSGELRSSPPLSDPAVFPYVGAVQRLVELAGDAADAVADPAEAGSGAGSSGRYRAVEIEGVRYRVFAQEAGAGKPLVLLHPGGADSRVWRHLLGDERLRSRFRMIAIDLPYHGKSLPPAGVEWWAHPYEASQERAAAWVLALLAALELEPTTVVGLGLGAQVAIELIGRAPERFRGAVAVNPWLRVAGDPFPVEVLFHPRVFKRAFGSWIAGLMPAAVPKWRRMEAEWIFASQGPGVAKADTEAFESGYDVGAALDRLPATAPALELLVGGAMPAVEWRPAGAEPHLLDGFGYLPPLEHPGPFARRLEEILA